MDDIKWENLREVLEDYADFFIKNAQQNLFKKDAVASGNLSNSMELDKITITDEKMSVTISLADYWYYVENGRKAGKRPPMKAIEEWIVAKPVIPRTLTNGKVPTTKQLAYVIAKSIGENGTKKHPFFEPAKRFTQKEFKQRIADAVQADISIWLDEQVTKIMGIWL